MSIQTNCLPDNPNINILKPNKTGLFTNYIYKAIPLAFDESMSYYETLCGLLHYLKNVIIPTVNNNADAVAELQTLYEQLQDYVEKYFDNLDIQEEINNKLDQMVQDGTLTTILQGYLYNYINVKSVGAKGDGVTDDTQAIKNAIALNKPLYFPEGTYIVSETIIPTNDINWLGQGNKTIINSIPISDLHPNYVNPVVDFSNLNVIRLKGFSTTNSVYKIYPTPSDNQSIKQLMKNKTINIEDLTNNVDNNNMSGKTNWQGLFINTPAPDNYTRDFHNGKYSRYAIDINNNSGYNAINIDNIIKNNDEFEIIPDNSAIGIVDGVLSSAPAFFIDMHAERSSIGIKNRTASSSASSTIRPDLVYEVSYNGHLAIGCSVYDEDTAQGVSTVKLRDINPSIKFYSHY